MVHETSSKLEDAELIEGLFEIDASEVVEFFGGHSQTSFRNVLTDTGSTMSYMFVYSIISSKGLAYFLPAIDDYARSADSELDSDFPSSFAHAIRNQLRIRPVAVIAIRDQIEALSTWLLDNLRRFDQGDAWRNETSAALSAVLDILRRENDVG